jgi:crossover junction endodeoxyribonuclease RuvC
MCYHPEYTVPTLLKGHHPMCTLAIDQAITTGWALRDDTGEVYFGHLKLRRTHHPGSIFNGFRQWLLKMVDDWQPDKIVCEAPVGKFFKAVQMGAGLRAVAAAVAAERGLPFIDKAPKEVKKYITGNGNATKTDMLKKIRSMGFDVSTSDEADAVGILLTASDKRCVGT